MYAFEKGLLLNATFEALMKLTNGDVPEQANASFSARMLISRVLHERGRPAIKTILLITLTPVGEKRPRIAALLFYAVVSFSTIMPLINNLPLRFPYPPLGPS
jgi:hypothetical protein